LAASGVNVRQGPGTKYDVVGAVAKGTTVKVYGEDYLDKDGNIWLSLTPDGSIDNDMSRWICHTYMRDGIPELYLDITTTEI
jgi:hypothetical protein